MDLQAIKAPSYCYLCDREADARVLREYGYSSVAVLPAEIDEKPHLLDNCIHFFNNKNTIFFANSLTDEGFRMRTEMIRRLGEPRCRDLEYPAGMNSVEDVYNDEGFPAIREICSHPQEVNTYGQYGGFERLRERWSEDGNNVKIEREPTFRCGIGKMDDFVSFRPEGLCAIAGMPMSGKSELAMQLAVNFNILHGWRAAFVRYRYDRNIQFYGGLLSKMSGRNIYECVYSASDYKKLKKDIDNNFCILNYDGEDVEGIIQMAVKAVYDFGIRVLVVDLPYTLWLADPRSGPIREARVWLDKLEAFSRSKGVLVILTVPARKDFGEPYTFLRLTGCMDYLNKADYAITIGSDSHPRGIAKITLEKVFNNDYGHADSALFRFHPEVGFKNYQPAKPEEVKPESAIEELAPEPAIEESQPGKPKQPLFIVKTANEFMREAAERKPAPEYPREPSEPKHISEVLKEIMVEPESDLVETIPEEEEVESIQEQPKPPITFSNNPEEIPFDFD